MQSRFEVFDAHVDTILRELDLGEDLGVGPGVVDAARHLDLVRGREGGLAAVVFAAWVSPHFVRGSEVLLEPSAPAGGANTRVHAILDTAHALAARHPDQVAIVRNGAELAAARSAGQIAAILGIEGGHAIENSLAKLDEVHARGVRLMTLVWNNHLPWIRSCQIVPPDLAFEVPAGLSPFGRNVIERMNELHMLADVSHSSQQTFDDVLETSTAPVLASHSGCTAIRDHPRNLTDAQLRRLADAGGCVGIVFHGGFLDDEAAAEDARIYASPEYRSIRKGENAPRGAALEYAQNAYHQRIAKPMSIEVVTDHIMHGVQVAGIEHVGLGSDYDGIPRTPEGLETAACYPNLAASLERRGLSDREIEAVLGGNLRRLFNDVCR
ncbi:MAG: membrane dipeptidase [Planctomycetota bacterium]|jgi:membrane dipeptidase